MAHTNTDKRKEFEDAYDALFEQIFNFLAKRLSDRERAKELAQETFMRTWMHLAAGKKVFAMRPFLYTTAYNLFKNELRAKREIISLDALMAETNFEPQVQSESAEERGTVQELFEEIHKLPALYKEPLILRYAEGWPIKKIARELVETESAIAVRIHRATKALKKHYEKLD